MMLRRFAPALLAVAGLAGLVQPEVALARSRSDEAKGPQKLVDKAASVMVEIGRDRNIRPLIAQAVGFYIIPEYGRAGFLIGGKGGAGLVVARTPGGWSSPAFFNTGGLSIGAQIGAAGGSIVYLLMDRKAVDVFRNPQKFSVGADAGLSVVTYSQGGAVSSNKGDAVLWTNIRGAYAGAVVGANGIDKDNGRTRDYYGRDVPVDVLLDGGVTAPGARALTRVLPR